MKKSKIMMWILSIFVTIFIVGCGGSSGSKTGLDTLSTNTKKIDISVSIPDMSGKFSKSTRALNIIIAKVTLDINSSSHIYMEDVAFTKEVVGSNNWNITTTLLPMDKPLAFRVKAYTSAGELIFTGVHNRALSEKLVAMTILLHRVTGSTNVPTLNSILFNNDKKTDITFNIYNPNAYELSSYKIKSLSENGGSFTPSSGTIDFNSTSNYILVHATRTPPSTYGSYTYRFTITNHDGLTFEKIFTIVDDPDTAYSKADDVFIPDTEIEVSENSEADEVYIPDGDTYTRILDLKALVCKKDKLYYINSDGEVVWLKDDVWSYIILFKPVVVNNIAYFMAKVKDDFNNFNSVLWKSDGTPEATVMVKDINPSGDSDILYITDINGTLYFQANDGTHGGELWKSDGTEVGTVMVKDINPRRSSSLRYLTNLNDILYFRADNGTDGYELWKSDGTEVGTVMVKDINPSEGSDPAGLTNVNGILYFRANDGINGYELWKSDGTEAGTLMVKNINPSGNSSPSGLININGTLYFSADDGIHGRELWKSDGTSDGTIMVKDINPSGDSDILYITDINGTLYFQANDGIHGKELWKSDGTEAGTLMVKNINPSENSSLSELTNINGTLYFQANDGTHGRELWKSDGTEDGTVMVKDINPGGDSWPSSLTNIDNTLYFKTYDISTDIRELWKSDGTESGTVKVTLPQ